MDISYIYYYDTKIDLSLSATDSTKKFFMNYHFGILSWWLFASFLVSFLVSVYSWRQRQIKSGFYLALLGAAIAQWALAGVFEAAATEVSHKFLWSQISYLGIVTTPLLYMLFALSYGHYENMLTKGYIILASIIPFMTLILAITSNYHQWLWLEVLISDEGNIGIYNHGFWFLIHIAYSYLMILIGMVVIITAVRRVSSVFQSQVLIMIIGAALPLFANIVYVFGKNPIPGLDWTPVAFGFSGLLMSVGIFRFSMLNVIPIARNILVETMNDGVLVIDTNDRVLDINPTMALILDRSPAQIIGLSTQEALSDWPDAMECLKQNMEFQTTIIKQTSSRDEHYDFQVTKIERQDGNELGRLVVCRDTTDKINAQLDLVESRTRLRTLSNAATEAIFISEGGICLEQNKTAEKMFGYTLEEAIGKAGSDWVIPEHREIVKQNMLAGFEGPYNVTALRKDKTTFLAEIVAKMMQYKGRDVRISILRDITQQREAESKLLASEQSLKEAQRIAHIGNWSLDISSNSLTWSEENYNIFEIDRLKEEVTFDAVVKQIHHDDREFFKQTYTESIKNKQPFDFNSRVVMDDGRIKFINLKGEIFFDGESKPLRSIGTIQDITAIKLAEGQVEKALLEAQKANTVKDQFIANISHEIRTPLTSITGFTSRLKEGIGDKLNADEQEYFKYITQNSERLMSTVDSILNLSQLEAGTIKLSPRILKMDQLIRLIIAKLEPRAIAAGIKLEFKSQLDDDSVWADEATLLEAINNITTNAIKYTNEGQVVLQLRRDEKLLTLTIQDTGIGISDGYRQRMFQLFSQESEGIAKDFQGIGLGLALAKRYLDMNEINIRVDSEKGQGSKFILTFPNN